MTENQQDKNASVLETRLAADPLSGPLSAAEPPSPPRFWVGIGASAGGLEALRGLVRNLPRDLSATYIVVQHMAPQHRSMLSQIIGRETPMSVLDVTDNLEPLANTLYVTPPNSNIIVEKGRLRLVEPSWEPAASKPSIDVFLESLSIAKKDSAIAIVLSGTGSDGSKGIRAIRERGGVTIAQDEMTAKYSSMPVAALETGCVDLVMSPEEIGSQFPKVVRLPRDFEALKASPLDMDSMAELVQVLLDQTGVNFRNYKTATVQRRIERRMAAVDVQSLEDYVEIAKISSREVEALFRDLLISVTSFFRDPDEFQSLRSYIRQIVDEKGDDPIRVWVPGTATGEEAYTIAMLFADEMGGTRAFANSGIQIFATDVDEQAIEVARRAFYAETALAAIPDEVVRQYFETAPAGYNVKKALRDKIVFSIHDVAHDPPYLNLDLISCRNLLIYFQASLQAQVFSRFHYALVPHGVLFLGKAEAVGAGDTLFRPAKSDKHIFYQRPSKDRRLLREYDPVGPPRRGARPSQPLSTEARDLVNLRAQFDSLVASVGPNAILVNEQLRVVRAYGDLERYVSLSAGTVDNSLASLLRAPYLQEVRAIVPSAVRRQEACRGVIRVDPENQNRREQINVYPVAGGERDEPFALVVFSGWEVEISEAESRRTVPGDESDEVHRLREELAIAHAHLRQLIEDADANSEETHTLNEELQASNEELQSTNEEMETSNEELQSTNEELSTVNEELQVNGQQLNAVNQSLRNILENVAIPMLVVDRALNITNASRASEEIFGVDPDLTLPHVSRCRIPDHFPNLTQLLEEAMDSEVRVDRIIDDEQSSATLIAVPHFSTADEVVGGIVLLSDNSEELRRTRNELRLVIDNLPASIIVRDSNSTILKANRLTSRFFGVPIEEIEGRPLADFCDETAMATVLALDEAAIQANEPLVAQDVPFVSPDGSARLLNTSRVPIVDTRTGETLMYSMAIDVTEQRQTTEALRVSEQRLERAVRASGLGHWDLDLASEEIFVSARFREILGLKEDDRFETFQDFVAMVHPDDVEKLLDVNKRRISNPEPIEEEIRIRHADNSIRWISSVGEAQLDEHGNVVRLVGTARDVTMRKQADLQLRELNDQLALASKLAAVGFWKIDLVENTLLWSDEVFTIHGLEIGSAQPDIEEAVNFYHPDDLVRVEQVVTAAMSDGQPFEFEARILRADGSERLVRSTSSLGADSAGNVSSVFGVFRDITEDRERERELEELLTELSRSNEELSRFSYVCSHDMKEPVRMIENMADLLLDPEVGEDEERRSELLTRIGSNMTRLRAIIDSLLAYSRVEAKVEVDKVDLNDLLVEVIETMKPTIEENNMKVKIGALPSVLGARVHFMQLFQNLIGNAIKYAKHDRPILDISFEESLQRHVIRVEDNGPGIPTSARNTVFELFGRLNVEDGIEGTGLGLSICRRIVNQYEGTIHCESSHLGGASFVISLPAKAEAHVQ